MAGHGTTVTALVPAASGSAGARERAALLSALAAVAAWSTVATGFKLGLATLAPLQLLCLGVWWSAALFALVAGARGDWRPPAGRPTPDFLARMAALGLVNPLLYYMVLFEAYDRLPAQIAQPLNYTWAVTLSLLAVPVLGQRLTRHALAGLLLGYAGVVVVLTQGRLDGWAGVDWPGVALALASTLLWAGYWLANARTRVAPVTLMAWSFLLALPAVTLACHLGPGLPPLTWRHLGFGAWVGLVEMGFAFLLWQRALRLTRHTARIGTLIFLSPVVSLWLIGAVLGEQVHVTSWIGLAVIIAGVVLARRGGPAQPQPGAADA